MADPRGLPRVALVALGGTIASIPTTAGGAVPTLDAADLASGIPGLADAAAVEVFNFRQLPGAHLQIGDLIELASFVRELDRRGFAGVIVTQGTDTIEETAFALDLQLVGPIPVIVTGAMRGPSVPGAEGAANILASTRLAASEASRDCGVMVLMDDTIHAARWVRKAHTTRPSAFVSTMAGPLGWITEDRVTIAWKPRVRATLGPLTASDRTKVGLVPTWLGDDGTLLEAAAAAGYRAIVIAATGGGHVNPTIADAIGRLTARMPVILASRTGSGEILRHTYGFAGSEIDLVARGCTPAGALEPVKARLLLELLLARDGTTPADAIADFAAYAASG